MAPFGATAVHAAPRGWRPQAALFGYYPAIAELYRMTLPEIRDHEKRLDRDEAAGRDTVRERQAIGELLWRLQYTGNAEAARAALARVRSLAAVSPPSPASGRNQQGSFGIGTDVWFLQLDASVDPLLTEDHEAQDNPPRFLDRVNDPGRLTDYLNSLVVSDLANDGVDRRKELNLATGDLVRLILRRRPRGYPWDIRLETVVRRFVAEWQDPATGFFGADYQIGDERWRTADLSMTFHMARYLEGNIGYWPQLIDTLLAIRDERYPNGWLDDEGMTSHNNYDVAVLFRLGWPEMRPDQRDRAGRELARMLDWCLESAIAPDGTLLARAVGESLPDSYYFAIAFLDTVGFFDPAKRFWTNRSFPRAAGLRGQLEHRVCALHPNDPMVPLTLARLRR
jgi:hypothetical protein